MLLSLYDDSILQRLLREDIAAGLHINITPREFRRTRAEYMSLDLTVFRGRIDQEKQRIKFQRTYGRLPPNEQA